MRPIAHPSTTTPPFFFEHTLLCLASLPMRNNPIPSASSLPICADLLNGSAHSLDLAGLYGQLYPSHATCPVGAGRASSLSCFLFDLNPQACSSIFPIATIIVHRRHQTHLHAFGERHCRASPAVHRFGTIASARCPCARACQRRKVWTFFPLPG
jgi:hypothetical protein